MTVRTIPLFIHLLGVVTLFLAIGIVQRVGARVRASSTVEEMRLWLGLGQSTRAMFPAALLLILASGLYMTHRTWTFGTPWVFVAMVSIVVMGILGGAVVGRGLAAIGRAATGTGPVPPELAHIVARPAPWVAAAAFNCIAFGILWLMVAKPGWAQSIAVVMTLGVLGSLVGSITARSSEGTRRQTRLVTGGGMGTRRGPASDHA